MQGRIGNQLFQFAFAKLLAEQLKTRFLLDITDESFGLPYFKLTGYWFILNNRLAGKVYNQLQKVLLTNCDELDVRDCFKELPFNKFVNNKNYRGYFQDFRIFENHKEKLQRWFVVRDKFRRTFEAKYLPMLKRKKSIVVHFRLNDYHSFEPFFVNGRPPIVPIEWYFKVLSKFDSYEFDIYCISDDIITVSKQFQPQGFNVHYVQEDVITDFLLLNNADVCIISNSTFAWWGAFLNQKAEVIICPEYFLGVNHGQEYPPNIYPPHWVKISTSLN